MILGNHSPISILCIAGSLLSLMGCSNSKEKKYEAHAIPVFSEEVTSRDVPIYFESIGSLLPSQIVEIRPQASGMLKNVHFSEGNFIKAGMPLFSIDPGPYSAKVKELAAILKQNKIALEVAEKKLEKFQQLSNLDMISLLEWENLKSSVEQLEALVEQHEVKLEAAMLELQNCTIRSPIEGKVSRILIHPGNLVSASQPKPLATVLKIDKLLVEFSLTEKEFDILRSKGISNRYTIEISPLSNKENLSSGLLTFLDHQFDPLSGLLQVRGIIDNSDLRYLPGQSVKVRLPVSIIRNAHTIPEKAIKINQHGPYVFVIDENNRTAMRQISTGEQIGDMMIVEKGLNHGEKVVTDGHLRLSPGCRVEIRDESEWQ